MDKNLLEQNYYSTWSMDMSETEPVGKCKGHKAWNNWLRTQCEQPCELKK